MLSLRTQAEATTDSVFKIGSITKIWTATLIQQLVDDGVLDLDRPVRDYLPGFRLRDPAATAALTARHLLTHTGGIDGNDAKLPDLRPHRLCHTYATRLREGGADVGQVQALLGHASLNTRARYFRAGTAEQAAVVNRVFD
ncbi:serine hydrolase [Nonomuraea wenchangensis]